MGSDILKLEIERMHDEVKKYRIRELYNVVGENVIYTEAIKKRAQEIMEQSNIRSFDSMHIASAETANADVMLTTDDKLEKMASKLQLKIRVMNPLKFAWEAI